MRRWISTACLAAVVMSLVAADTPPARPATGLAKMGVFVDKEKAEIALEGAIVFRADDILEYFCCLKGTAEHESIIAVTANPLAVRLALMLPPFRLKPGSVVKWDDRVKPPTGPTILVFAEYKDPKTGKTVRVRAEDWVMLSSKDPITGKWTRTPMRKTGFVFAGGSFFENPETKEKFFLAKDDGAIVTVFNRITSVIDNPQKEGATDEFWYPNIPRIPPLGTKVRVILKPAPQPTTRPTSRPAARSGKGQE